MKTLVLILLTIMVGCTRPPIEHKKPDGPAPRPPSKYRKRTMVCDAQSKRKIIAVIDTGFGWDGHGDTSILCKTGHKDFSDEQLYMMDNLKVPLDTHGHGTHIVGIIQKYAEDFSYCIVVIKYYGPNSDQKNLDNTVKSIEWATQIGADIINYSGGGIAPALAETQAIKKFLDKGGQFVAAAGNERSDLSVRKYYPAMADDRVIVVGNGESNEERRPTSNYGEPVDRWEDGRQAVYGFFMEGTSQSAAVATGKIISQKSCKISFDNVSK